MSADEQAICTAPAVDVVQRNRDKRRTDARRDDQDPSRFERESFEQLASHTSGRSHDEGRAADEWPREEPCDSAVRRREVARLEQRAEVVDHWDVTTSGKRAPAGRAPEDVRLDTADEARQRDLLPEVATCAVPVLGRLELGDLGRIELQPPVRRDQHAHPAVDVLPKPSQDLSCVALHARGAHRQEPTVDGDDRHGHRGRAHRQGRYRRCYDPSAPCSSRLGTTGPCARAPRPDRPVAASRWPWLLPRRPPSVPAPAAGPRWLRRWGRSSGRPARPGARRASGSSLFSRPHVDRSGRRIGVGRGGDKCRGGVLDIDPVDLAVPARQLRRLAAKQRENHVWDQLPRVLLSGAVGHEDPQRHDRQIPDRREQLAVRSRGGLRSGVRRRGRLAGLGLLERPREDDSGLSCSATAVSRFTVVVTFAWSISVTRSRSRAARESPARWKTTSGLTSATSRRTASPSARSVSCHVSNSEGGWESRDTAWIWTSSARSRSMRCEPIEPTRPGHERSAATHGGVAHRCVVESAKSSSCSFQSKSTRRS